MLFNEKKAAQVAAFFLHSAGSKLDLLKLMKLMYLAERNSLAEYGEPMIGDLLYSMEHGPVLSHTLNHTNGLRESTPDGWDSWVRDRANHQLSLRKPITNIKRDLSLLSDADLEILQSLWAKHGHLSGFQLRDLTHEICDEWEDPENSSIPIPYSRLLRCVGYSSEVAKELEKRMCAQRQVESLLSSS
jgi:uncharacterized phage-associated protein